MSVRTDVAEMLHEQVEYRELLYQMTRRDLLLRYKQTIMGIAWSVVRPLLTMVIFTIVFSRVKVCSPLFPWTTSGLPRTSKKLSSNTCAPAKL